MSVHLLSQELSQLLTVDKVATDVRTYLFKKSSSQEIPVELMEGGFVQISKDVKIDIVRRVLVQEEFEIEFRTGCRILAALGGVKSIQYGVVEANIAFATLYYNENLELITADFHQKP